MRWGLWKRLAPGFGMFVSFRGGRGHGAFWLGVALALVFIIMTIGGH